MGVNEPIPTIKKMPLAEARGCALQVTCLETSISRAIFMST